ncbi:hypothetical protein [Alicyclobacillus ferrooxydans]|uniref:Uncharacterized protein n=1 Tax=Alicyclobacillus ferrooxydans TaxID=471514 RepID=A0A0P9E9C1_9BACL|nr:hypothetical protein [Alicyclobacillus ferrooxydans]KPV38971.1 hypothetical protein AN477_23390 [Alicyclobacillus ferrooxydans]
MNPVFQSLRETVKHGLAIVLFILLLLGMMGAGLGIFSAGISALSTHQPPVITEPTVPALSSGTSGSGVSSSQTSQGQGTGTAGHYPGASQGNQGASQPGFQGNTRKGSGQSGTQSSTQGSTQGSTQSSGVGWSGPSQTVPRSLVGQDLASRMDRKLRDMQSPVTGRLDTGGVALGDQVQSAFGHFLSGLLQTLFVEQAGSGSGASGGSAQGTVVPGSSSQAGAP